MKLEIVKGDITKIKCDAIVCSTNKELIPLGSIDTAIHGAAGPELEKACEKIQRCDVGKCVVTEGYNLPCRYIIHTVSPHISEASSVHLLAQCYKNAITEAIRMGISSVAFPLLGAGDNGFSTQKALDIALNRFEVSMRDVISELTVYLVLFHQEDLLYAKKLAGEKHLAINDCEVDDMLPENKRWISLCKVNRPDKNKDIWSLRR